MPPLHILKKKRNWSETEPLQKGFILQKKNIFKNSLISGTLILTLTGIFSRFIGFYYKIFLSRTIGAQGLGIYQLIFPVFSLLISISVSGIQTAISRYCAQCENDRQARGYLYTGLVLSMSLSVICMLFLRQGADWIGRTVLGDETCVNLLLIMSWALLPCCIHSCINGYYYGKKKAAIPAISQLLEQAIRVLGVYLLARILLEQTGTLTSAIAVWGILIGEAASSLFSLTMVCCFSKKEARLHDSLPVSSRFCKKNMPRKAYFTDLVSMAAPLTLNRILLSLCQSGEALLIPIELRAFGYTNTDAFSIYGILTGMVFSTIMFPAVLSNSLSVMLLPAISKASARGRQDLVTAAVCRTVECCTILGLACTFGFLLTGNWIGTHLFHNTLAGVYIKTLSWICPFLFLGSTLTSILHGLGKATTTLLINLASALIRIGFIVLGIPLFGLKSYLWGMLVSQIFTALCAYFCIRRASTSFDK